MKKTFTIIFFIISIILLALIIYFLFFYDFGSGGKFFEKKEGTGGNTSQDNFLIELDNRSAGGNNELAFESQKNDVIKLDIEQLAAGFAERFGSYSNQSDFRNITDLKIFMSDNMKAWSLEHTAGLRDENKLGEEYYGITTKAVSQKSTEYDETLGKATVVVNTRRAEASDVFENTTKVFNQDLTVNFIKEGGEWKVDGVVWGGS
jgi:hypothetical protein